MSKANRFSQREKFYEIIGPEDVIGVCTEQDLLSMVKDYNVRFFGDITKEEYKEFIGYNWSEPISKIRYRPEIIETVKLHKYEQRWQSLR